MLVQVSLNLELTETILNNELGFNDFLIQRIDLSNRSISNIENGAFRHYPNLAFINLKNNKLANLTWEAFRGLSKLVEIDLGQNRLDSLENLFVGMDRLESIYLSNNRLTRLDFNWFRDTKSLQQLDLRTNRIETIENEMILNDNDLNVLPHLSSLLISGNRLTSISLKPLKTLLISLVTFHADGNMICSLQELESTLNNNLEFKFDGLNDIDFSNNSLIYADFDRLKFANTNTQEILISICLNPISINLTNLTSIDCGQAKLNELKAYFIKNVIQVTSVDISKCEDEVTQEIDLLKINDGNVCVLFFNSQI
jgi:Leucine-rich repeat (LRR) protein